MQLATRHLLFRIYAIFFIIITPFVVIYSLGYNFDWATGRLTRNLFLNVQTIPRAASVELPSGRTYTTPAALRISSSTPQRVVVTAEGYHPEEFRVWTDLTQNTTAYLQGLILLPVEGETLERLPAEREFLNFLPTNRFLATQNNLLYLYTYSPNSISAPVPVTTQVDKSRVETGEWAKVGKSAYFNNQTSLLLYLDPTLSTWRLEDLNQTVPDSAYIVATGRGSFLVLDTQGNLYLWDLSRQTVQFIDSGYHGLVRSANSEFIWLRRGDTLLQLNQLQATYASLIQAPEQFAFATFQGPASAQVERLEVARVYRGLGVTVGETLYFVGDTTPEVAGVVAVNVEAAAYGEEALFYLDEAGEVQMYNLVYDNQKSLTYVDSPREARLHFDPVLKRLLIYTPERVQAVWVDPKNFSNHLLTHSVVTWVEGQRCQVSTTVRTQVCAGENELIKYQNLLRF